MNQQLSNYVDFLVHTFGRRISPRLTSTERLVRLVDEEFSMYSEGERTTMVGLVLIKFSDLTVTRAVAHHPMKTRSMV